MTLQVFTAQMRYRGPDRFDVTRKSGGAAGRVFAPSWDLLRPALDARKLASRLRELGKDAEAELAEKRAWATYVPGFLREMAESRALYQRAWMELLERERVVLVCYCAPRELCHRGLLVPMLVELGAIDGGELHVDPRRRSA